jgi:hypothetical protein
MSEYTAAISPTMKLQPLSQASVNTATSSPSAKSLHQSSLADSINCSLQRVHSIVARRKEDDYSERRVLEAYERYKAMFLKPEMRMTLGENAETQQQRQQQQQKIQKEELERQQQEEQRAVIQRQLQQQQKQRLESLLPQQPKPESSPSQPSSSPFHPSCLNPCVSPFPHARFATVFL